MLRSAERPAPETEVLLCQTEDGTARIEVRFEGETAWMTRISLAELYQTTPAVVPFSGT